MDKQKAIIKANENLKKLFPNSYKPITELDVEKVYSRNILSIESDAKTSKGSKNGYLTGILYLAPANVSGIQTCPGRSQGCEAACLFTAGRGCMYPVFKARVIKTLAFYLDRSRFSDSLHESIRKLKVKAKNKNMVPVVRLNGTSDILFERLTDIMQRNSDIQFYDYTKLSHRFDTSKPVGQLPDNYDLTFSLHEENLANAQKVMQLGGRVAVVFRDSLPDSFWGYPVVNGDSTDLRFLDPKNVIVGLIAKGKAKKDTSGFVQN